jgi:hypothetical protein
MSRVKKQILGKLKEYANKMGKDHLGGDDIPSNKKRGGLRDNDGYDNVQYNRDMPQDESVTEQGVGTATVFLKNQEELDESFPNMKQWWKEDKKEVMSFIYFLQRQLPPSSKDKYEKAWKDIVVQLQKRTPAPKSIYQKLINEGRPIPMDTPNELVYLDFKKYAYKNRSMFKKELLKNKDNGGKMFLTLSALWYKWARKDNKEFTHIKDKLKFGRALMIMMVKDDVVFSKKAWKKTNQITNLKEGGLPQNWMAGRTSDYHTKLRGKKRNYDDTNFAKMNTGQPDIEDEELDPDNEVVNEKFNKVEHLSLLNKALKAMPGSQNQKEIIRQLNVVRKAGGMRPLKEQSIVEYASRLTNAYILDDESVLDGTPEPKDAINKESAKKKSEKNYKDWKNTNETVDKDDLKNAKFRLKKVLKYLDIEYKKTRRGEKYVQINYIPVTRPQSQNPEFVNVRYEDEKDLQNIGKALKLKLKESVSEVAERDYKDEYKKFQSSTKSKKYRAELNKYNRDKGTYGNGDNKDASHKGGKIVGFESQSKNRGRAEKSRLKKK